MGRALLFLGNFFRSSQGWALLMFTVLPTIWTAVTSYLDRLNWTERTLAVMAAMLVGLAITFFILRLLETSSNFFESRKEQSELRKI